MRSIAVRAAHSSERFEAKRERILPCSTVARAMTVIAREHVARTRAPPPDHLVSPASGAERPAAPLPFVLPRVSHFFSTFLV